MVSRHTDGEWLCPPGEYQSLVKAQCANDPRLRHRDEKAIRQNTPWPAGNGRVVNLRLGKSGLFEQVYSWSEGHRAKHDFYADLAQGKVVQAKDRNVLLVEGISPRMIEALGTRFGIHPSFFVDHERVGVFSGTQIPSSSLLALPHSMRWFAGTDGITFKYYEVLDLPRGLDSFNMCCADSGRHVAGFRLNGRISSTVVVRRKCSVWPSSNGAGGYTCVILCDPPLETVSVRFSREPRFYQPAEAQPYQGGYRDFMSQGVQKQRSEGPPRSSMLEDLRFYLIKHGDLLPRPDEAVSAADFVKKIVASHYLSLSSFIESILSHEQWHLSRKDNLRDWKLELAEQQWSDVQAWDRRISEYAGDIQDAMMKIGINFEDPNFRTAAGNSGLFDSDIDFQYLRMRFKTLAERVAQLNGAFTGLAGIAGTRQAQAEQERSTRESQRATALTSIGLLFVPLAFVSGLLSMNDRYIPGAGHFWVYFAVSIPLILVTLVVYAIIDGAYVQTFFMKRNSARIESQI